MKDTYSCLSRALTILLNRSSFLEFLYSFSASSTPPFHVAVFSFLVFAGYVHLEILKQWKTVYFHFYFFKIAGELAENITLFASWYCGFQTLQKNVRVFLEAIFPSLYKPSQACRDGRLEAWRTIRFE